MNLEKLYKKIGKKFDRYYKRSYHFNGSIICFTFDPHYGLTNNKGQKIELKLILPEKECYHKWRFFNRWCQECSEFGHGIIVSHCFKCNKLWDKENGFWSQEEIYNLFFNEHFQTLQ